MRKWTLVSLAAALAVSACSPELGPGRPVCDEAQGVTILQLQAVPDAEWGPCIEELKVGWDYEAQIAKAGEARFWIDSDRMGFRFLQVTLTAACDVSQAVPSSLGRDDIERYVNVLEEPRAIHLSIVPVAPRHEDYALGVVGHSAVRSVDGRAVAASIVNPTESASATIERLINAGNIVLVIDDREVASGTVELLRPGEEPEKLTLDEMFAALEDDLEEPAYRATWYHRFEGGCITFEIDATGDGALTLPRDIDNAIGFYPLGDLRRSARDAGLDV